MAVHQVSSIKKQQTRIKHEDSVYYTSNNVTYITASETSQITFHSYSILSYFLITMK